MQLKCLKLRDKEREIANLVFNVVPHILLIFTHTKSR